MTSLRQCLQRLSIIALSLMAILAITVPSAFAADGSATITINKGSIQKELTGMTVRAYMVLDRVNPDETDVTKKQFDVTEAFKPFFAMRDGENKLDDSVKNLFGKTDQNVVLTYDGNEISFSAPTNPIPAGSIVLTGVGAAQLDETYPEADLVSRLTEADTAATFYTWVEKYIETNTDPNGDGTLENSGWANPQENTCGKDDTSIQFAGLDEGYYALIFSSVPNGVSVKQGILIATSDSINLKAEPITVTKQVSKNNGKDYDDAVSAAMDTILKYKITSTVPTVTDYSNLTEFKLTDTYKHQQLVQKDGKNFQLQVDGKLYTLSSSSTQFVNDDEVIATLNTETEGEFTVNFNTDVLAKYQGKNIELTYYAQLTADAIDVNLNDVTLNYTNNGSMSTETDSTAVYTYGIDVTKTFSDSDGSEKLYEAVKFKLYADVNGAQGSSEIGLIGGSGIYRVPAADDTAPVSSLLSLNNNTGKLTITGLDAGTYWLEETEAPRGYTVANPIKITLAGSESDESELDQTESGAQYKNGTSLGVTYPTADNGISLLGFEVLNQKGFNLPQTGAAGVWLCVAGGLVLIALGGVLFVTSRGRRNSRA